MALRLQQLTEVIVRCAKHTLGHGLAGRAADLLGKGARLPTQRHALSVLSCYSIDDEQAVDGAEEGVLIPEAAGQLFGLNEGGSGRRCPAPGRTEQRLPQWQEEGQFARVALLARRERTHEPRRLAEMRRCFGLRRARQRAVACHLPPTDGLVQQAGLRVVPREDLGLGFGHAREPLIECLRDAAVELLALGPQQRGVGSVLEEGMPEAVDRVRRRAAAEEQPCLDQAT
jgi:hypothetical protein